MSGAITVEDDFREDIGNDVSVKLGCKREHVFAYECESGGTNISALDVTQAQLEAVVKQMGLRIKQVCEGENTESARVYVTDTRNIFTESEIVRKVGYGVVKPIGRINGTEFVSKTLSQAKLEELIRSLKLHVSEEGIVVGR
ncbi:hypothetical protein HZA42_04470 [Candidatus Peregrinibacteria bacterium]|nr:hypothetical protein [Candidatus Peregrinibacteria bacterium]